MNSQALSDWICHQYTAAHQAARNWVSRFQTGDEGATVIIDWMSPLQWRHNNHRGGVSNHRRVGRLLDRLFRRRSNKTSKLCLTGLCERHNSLTGQFPARRTSNAENVSICSIWWCHHAHVRETDWDGPAGKVLPVRRHSEHRNVTTYVHPNPWSGIDTLNLGPVSI